MRQTKKIIFYILLPILWNEIDAGFITNYPAAATTANLGVGTTIVQDSYSVPPAVETIGYDYNTITAPIPAPQPVVEKKIYVHVPPQLTEHSLQYGPPPLPPRKHYKIIFVKAPSPPNHAPVTSQVEEKTLVYVLVKKPEPPTVQEVQNNVKPSKPEVYFINYKTQKSGGSGHSQDHGQSHGYGHSHGNSGGFTGSLGGGGGAISAGDDNSLGGFAGLGVTNAGNGGNNGFGSGGSSNSLSQPQSAYLPPPSTYLPPNFLKS